VRLLVGLKDRDVLQGDIMPKPEAEKIPVTLVRV